MVIPAYEPDYRLENLVSSLKKEKNLKLIVVNDGSSSDDVFNKIKDDVIILKHDINLGKGIAMKTGLNYVLNNFKDESVNFADADGQHSSDDIIKLSLLDDNFSLIIGTRDFNLKHVPFSSRFGNRLTSLIVYNKTKKYIKDTQSGLRLIPYRYIKDIELLSVIDVLEDYSKDALLFMFVLAFSQFNFKDKNKKANSVFFNVFLILALIFSSVAFNTYSIDLEFKVLSDFANYGLS